MGLTEDASNANWAAIAEGIARAKFDGVEGEPGAMYHFTSTDGVNWVLSEEATE